MFYIIKCPYCGLIQVRESRKPITKVNFKCIKESCNKTRKAKQSNVYGLSIKIYDKTMSGTLAARICSEFKRKEWEEKGNNQDFN